MTVVLKDYAGKDGEVPHRSDQLKYEINLSKWNCKIASTHANVSEECSY